MSKRVFVGVIVVALAVVLTAGGLLASNMGFKLNYTLNKAAAGVSKSGKNTLALPDNRQTGMTTAKNLMDDIGLTSVANVQRFLKVTDSFATYTGRIGSGANFNLNAGEGYFVKMNSDVNYIVVGSDDPALATTLDKAAVGVSKSGKNFFAYNYHQTAATAKALMDDIGLTSTANVQRFLKTTDSFATYTGRIGSGANFNLTPGEAYFIKMNTTVNYTPSHY